jgi:hypothetical protein
MLEDGSVRSTDPEGEPYLRALRWPVDTPGGRYFAEFDNEGPVAREGQLLFFAQFLHAGQRQGHWNPCPLPGRERRDITCGRS